MSKQKTEEEQLSEYAAQALRGPKFGIFEQLLCQHLVQATVSADPLRKIQLIVEAALMVDTEKQKPLQIDLERLEVVRTVTEAFTHRSEKSNNVYDCMVNVRFGFEESEENYNRYVQPWHNGGHLLHYPTRLAELFSDLGTSYRVFYCASCHNVVADDQKGKIGMTDRDVCKFCGANLKASSYNPRPFFVHNPFRPHDSTPEWKMFFAICNCLSRAGYNRLKTSFLEWAMPFTMQLMRKLTQAVRPEIYNEIAKMFIKARRTEESEA